MSESDNGDVTESIGYSHAWIVKLTSIGTIQWQKSYGDSSISFDDGAGANSIQQTTDGGYIFAGNIDGIENYWIVKLNDTGGVQWQKKFHLDGFASTIQQTVDGGYIVAGINAILKLDDTGAIQWQVDDGTSTTLLFSVQQTTDGSYIACGWTITGSDYHGGGHDCLLMKISSSGSIVWRKCYGGSGEDEANAVKQTVDGGYILTGYTISNDGDVTDSLGKGDIWVVKVDTAGTIQWQRSYGGSGVDIGAAIQSVASGGYIITGSTTSNDGDIIGFHGEGSLLIGDTWVVKTDDTGAFQWQKCLGGTKDEIGNSICTTPDGGYTIFSSTTSNNDDVTDNHGGQDYWVVKLGGTTEVAQITNTPDVKIYPNPTHDIVNILAIGNISSELTTIDGKVIISRSNKTQLNISDLPTGNYILSVYDANDLLLKTEKLVKE